MVRGQYLSKNKLLKCDPDQRTEMLADEVGITKDELQSIWSLHLEKRVIPAAELLYEKTGRPESITSVNVSSIVYEDWRGQYHQITGGYLIAKLMKPIKGGINPDISERHRITYTQLLRDSVVRSKYTDKIVDASKEWSKFKLGTTDWQRSVIIPDKITPDSARLIGIDWGDGNASGYPYAIHLSGNNDDFEFYSKEVKPLLKKVHNMEVPVEVLKSQNVIHGKTYSGKRPMLQLGSKGITTWLVDDLGFPKNPNKKDVNLPKIDLNDENKAELFYGIVGSMGSLDIENRIKLTDKDEMFIKNLKELSQSLGYTPLFKPHTKPFLGADYTNYSITFSQRESKRMELINPKHHKR